MRPRKEDQEAHIMQTMRDSLNLIGRRLTGAVLHALLVTAVMAPIMTGIAGGFSAIGGSGALLVTLATVVLLTLISLALGGWPAYLRFWGNHDGPYITASLFDDGLTPREKFRLVLKSGCGRFWLALDLGWVTLLAVAMTWR
jgi:hypothetical protein